MNNRRQLRDAIADRLFEKVKNEGAIVSIFKQRFLPLKTLPAIIVYTNGDNSTKTADESTNRRIEDVSIVVYVEGLEEHEDPALGDKPLIDRIDDLVGQVEERFEFFRETLNGLCFRMNYSGTDIRIKTEGNQIKGIATVRYLLEVLEALPQTPPTP